MKKIIFILLIILLLINQAKNSIIEYSFFVAGHTYGSPAGKNRTGLYHYFWDKRNLILNDPTIKFGILTGDIVPKSSNEYWDAIDKDIKELNMPIYFALGNHDQSPSRELVEERYGPTYYSFKKNNDLFIILNPLLNQWNISGEQLQFLKETLKKNKETRNIFVFTHQVLWYKGNKEYKTIPINNAVGKSKEINFWTEIEPLLANTNKKVFFFAGDVGALGNGRIAFMVYQYDNISLIASGMGGGDYDNFLIVNVYNDGSVFIKPIPLHEKDILYFNNITKIKHVGGRPV